MMIIIKKQKKKRKKRTMAEANPSNSLIFQILLPDLTNGFKNFRVKPGLGFIYIEQIYNSNPVHTNA